jgi:hypothetical protein
MGYIGFLGWAITAFIVVGVVFKAIGINKDTVNEFFGENN